MIFQKHLKTVTYQEVKNAIELTNSMGAAAVYLKLDRRTFYKIATLHGLYNASPKKRARKYALEDILNGLHPQYPTSKLSKRLVDAKLKEYKCENCGIFEWNGKSISLELNHKDGNNGNHALMNLELICPNCHSQTPTYRSKKLTFCG